MSHEPNNHLQDATHRPEAVMSRSGDFKQQKKEKMEKALEEFAYKAWKDACKSELAYGETDAELEEKYNWAFWREKEFTPWWGSVCKDFLPADFEAAAWAAWKQWHIVNTSQPFDAPPRTPEESWDWVMVRMEFDAWYSAQPMTQPNTAPFVQLPAGYKQEEKVLKVLVSIAVTGSNFRSVYDYYGNRINAIDSADFSNITQQIVKELNQQK